MGIYSNSSLVKSIVVTGVTVMAFIAAILVTATPISADVSRMISSSSCTVSILIHVSTEEMGNQIYLPSSKSSNAPSAETSVYE